MNLGLLTSVSKLFKENVSLCIICVGFQPTSNYPLRSNYFQTLWKWVCMSSNGRQTLGKLIEACYILRPFYIKFMWGLFICWGLFLQKFFLRGLFLRSLFTPTPRWLKTHLLTHLLMTPYQKYKGINLETEYNLTSSGTFWIHFGQALIYFIYKMWSRY